MVRVNMKYVWLFELLSLLQGKMEEKNLYQPMYYKCCYKEGAHVHGVVDRAMITLKRLIFPLYQLTVFTRLGVP